MLILITVLLFVFAFLGYTIKRFMTGVTTEYRVVKETYGDGRTTYRIERRYVGLLAMSWGETGLPISDTLESAIKWKEHALALDAADTIVKKEVIK